MAVLLFGVFAPAALAAQAPSSNGHAAAPADADLLVSHSAAGVPWAYLAIIALCLMGVAGLVVMSGHRSVRRKQRPHG